MILNIVDIIILVSTGDREFLLSCFGSKHEGKSNIVFNAINPTLYSAVPLKAELPFPSKGMIVLTLAELNNQKGHRYLLDAIPFILKEIPNVFFLFAGEGHLRSELVSHVEQLNIHDNVIFLGKRTDVPILLRSADLVVLPSLFEGLPFALLEAMAAERAIVASNVPGIQDAVIDSDNGFLVEPMNAHHLAERITFILKNSKLRQEMGRRGRIRVEQFFDEKKICTQIDLLYRKTD